MFVGRDVSTSAGDQDLLRGRASKCGTRTQRQPDPGRRYERYTPVRWSMCTMSTARASSSMRQITR